MWKKPRTRRQFLSARREARAEIPLFWKNSSSCPKAFLKAANFRTRQQTLFFFFFFLAEPNNVRSCYSVRNRENRENLHIFVAHEIGSGDVEGGKARIPSFHELVESEREAKQRSESLEASRRRVAVRCAHPRAKASYSIHTLCGRKRELVDPCECARCSSRRSAGSNSGLLSCLCLVNAFMRS